MNKLCMLGAALALAGLPLAAAATELYGRVHLSLDYLHDGGEGASNISSNSSRLGVRGGQPVLPATDAVFQLESEFRGDVGGGEWAVRDTFVGLQGGLGLLRVGRFGTPLRELGREVDLFGSQVGDSRNIIRNRPGDPGAPETAGRGLGGQGFDERFANGIHYRSPRLGNWQLDLHYSTNADDEPYTPDNSGDAVSLALSYRFVGMYLGLAHENYSGGREALRYAGAYRIGGWRFTTLWQRATDPDDRAYGAGLSYQPGQTAWRLQGYRLSAAESAYDARMLALGVEHQLTSQFSLYLNYAHMDNAAGSALTPFQAGRSATAELEHELTAGEDTRAFSLGLDYRF